MDEARGALGVFESAAKCLAPPRYARCSFLSFTIVTEGTAALPHALAHINYGQLMEANMLAALSANKINTPGILVAQRVTAPRSSSAATTVVRTVARSLNDWQWE